MLRHLKVTIFVIAVSLATILGLNFFLFCAFALKDYIHPPPTNLIFKKYRGTEKHIDVLYPGMTLSDVEGLLSETWGHPAEFDAFTHFKNAETRGKWVNVHKAGFRHTGRQKSWPPDQTGVSVFFFGGSTAFNFGVPDNDTIASQLEERLCQSLGTNSQVYNFGRAMYYSTQERILFEKLLVGGHIPDMVIFLDGLNDLSFAFEDDERVFADMFRSVFHPLSFWQIVKGRGSNVLFESSLERFSRAVKSRLSNTEPSSGIDPGIDSGNGEPNWYPDQPQQFTEKGIRMMHELQKRYLANKRIIKAVSDRFGIIPIFVWQPVPYYKYDNRYHIFKNAIDTYGAIVYPLMAERRPQLGQNFLWMADIQESLKEPLYVDLLHYTGKMSKMLADAIHSELVKRGFIDKLRTKGL